MTNNSGYHNSGDYNSMDCNFGDWNSGNCNFGDWNSGYYNSGYYNSGHRNSGNCNSGYYNSGYYNSGYYNSGHRNSGDWNSGNYHVGCFNSMDAETAYYFNKPMKISEWNDADKPLWIYKVSPTTWVPSHMMTDEEKLQHPEHVTTGGYLRKNDMKEQWRLAFNAATKEDIELTKQLPNFDADVFLEITGIDLRENNSCDGREIEIDGITYVLTKK